MEHVVTRAAQPAAPAVTDVVGEAPSRTDKEDRLERRRRIAKLREAIENGEYCVSTPDLADAILRAARVATNAPAVQLTIRLAVYPMKRVKPMFTAAHSIAQ